MTDTPPTQPEDEGSASQESKPNWRRDLEARAKRADELEAQLVDLQRREVFRDAGLNPSDGMTAYFMKGYDGDLTVEAIQAEATNLGLGSTPPPAVREDLGAEARIANAAEDAPPIAPPDLLSQIRSANSEDELRAVIEAAGGGWNEAV